MSGLRTCEQVDICGGWRGGVSMERLTKKHYDGNGYYMACSEHCNKECFDCKEIDKIIDRLGTYEDAGLEPEEIKKHEAAYNECLTRTYGPFKQKISQWLQAEQTGRLVVLPCKVGDTVYQIDAERVYESEVKWIIFDCDDIAFDERAIGGSIFLTREEAEAALKGGEG